MMCIFPGKVIQFQGKKVARQQFKIVSKTEKEKPDTRSGLFCQSAKTPFIF